MRAFSAVSQGDVFCSCSGSFSCCCFPVFLKSEISGYWPPSAPGQLALSSRRAPLRQGSCCAPASLRRIPAGFGPYG
ncbi:TPA: hypothetical protein F6V94_15290 [Serratia marcescens]|nr:hypothetical protein [Salmonella enterica subsp. enterica serovar Wandsworth]EGZ3950722.1 hypothetical protein [Salmonella enterica subsp. enterica serovar Wandsworth]HAU4401862.1 hypothetical protein [Serratia marcescens]